MQNNVLNNQRFTWNMQYQNADYQAMQNATRLLIAFEYSFGTEGVGPEHIARFAKVTQELLGFDSVHIVRTGPKTLRCQAETDPRTFFLHLKQYQNYMLRTGAQSITIVWEEPETRHGTLRGSIYSQARYSAIQGCFNPDSFVLPLTNTPQNYHYEFTFGKSIMKRTNPYAPCTSTQNQNIRRMPLREATELFEHGKLNKQELEELAIRYYMRSCFWQGISVGLFCLGVIFFCMGVSNAN